MSAGGHRLKSDEGVHIRGPVVFGKDVILRKGVVITGPSFVGDRAVVGQGCRVKNSTIRADSEIQFGTPRRTCRDRERRFHRSGTRS